MLRIYTNGRNCKFNCLKLFKLFCQCFRSWQQIQRKVISSTIVHEEDCWLFCKTRHQLLTNG